ncbi:MAG: pyridoxine 5'-phosphate synthase [Candidatus Riflebacteria bacterium]|nr:pyridoxine 5'-phosphate synthase [Candidatus Riflebacteria bacterium]
MIKLGVNIDHVATIRQARRGREPDPVWAAGIAEMAGADGITVHLREDRRHIQDRDVRILRETVRTRLNLEMGATKEIVAIAVGLQPDMATLVPERRQEITTEGGLDVAGQVRKIRDAVRKLQKVGIAVSLFIDPVAEQVKAAAEAGAEFVEFHTGRYAEARGEAEVEHELGTLYEMAEMGVDLGLRINAGHGISYWNVAPLVRMAGLEEFNIGHSIISRAVLTGLAQAVGDMKKAIREAEQEQGVIG